MLTTTLQLLPWPPEPARAAVLLLPPLLLAAVVVCLWALLSRSLFSRERPAGGSKEQQAAPARLPPGSFGWPLVGETLDFVSCAYSSRPEAFVDKRRLL
jgi:steroid 3-oxidase